VGAKRVWARNLVFVSLCAAGLLALGASLSPSHKPRPLKGLGRDADAEFTDVVERVNAAFRQEWAAQKLKPAAKADDLTIARRLSLALMGTIPSLEDVRMLEARPTDRRLAEWTARILEDRRHSDYLAERLARAYVGTKDGAFIVYRRGRFVSWLAEQLRNQRPYRDLVTDMITSGGLGTDQPATNFIWVTVKPGQEGAQPDESELAARVSRAFLGVRIDCAECHDHPFEPWKQRDFQGLAAFFGQTQRSFTGIHDVKRREYEVEDRKTGKPETVQPCVPFQSELVGKDGTRRRQLAEWVTDEKNERFSRALVNRIWALMFGRGLVEPIDDIRGDSPVPPALDALAKDFAEHSSLRRLIQQIAATEVFQLDSRADESVPGHEITPAHETAWAAFPVTRLRPEQVVGSVVQAASLETLDYESHIILQLLRYRDENDFVKRYGDAGEDEMADQGATIPQRLLLMNGRLVKDRTQESPLFNAATQIAMVSSSDQQAVETAYLSVLTRRPTAAEAEHFAGRLADTKSRRRNQRLEDLYWTLINSTEFSWNH
jgi:hypothetical protein